jgi:hypothetical protein
MKSELVTASTVLLLWLLFAMLVCTVSAQNVELLSEGDTFTYKRYHVLISNDPKAASEASSDFFTRNNSIVTVRIDNVSSTVIGIQITIRYQNGTQINESMIHDLVTGYNTANTVFGDPRGGSATDLIQRPQKKVDYTETRRYGEITRKVNVFSTIEFGWTMFYHAVFNVTITGKHSYDSQTGMFLESESEMFTYNRNNLDLNQTIYDFFVLTDTNVWLAPKLPSAPDAPSSPPLLLLTVATAIVVVVAVVGAVMVYLKKRRRLPKESREVLS